MHSISADSEPHTELSTKTGFFTAIKNIELKDSGRWLFGNVQIIHTTLIETAKTQMYKNDMYIVNRDHITATATTTTTTKKYD